MIFSVLIFIAKQWLDHWLNLFKCLHSISSHVVLFSYFLHWISHLISIMESLLAPDWVLVVGLDTHPTSTSSMHALPPFHVPVKNIWISRPVNGSPAVPMVGSQPRSLMMWVKLFEELLTWTHASQCYNKINAWQEITKSTKKQIVQLLNSQTHPLVCAAKARSPYLWPWFEHICK